MLKSNGLVESASAGEAPEREFPSGEAVRGDRPGDLFLLVDEEFDAVLDPAEAFFTTELLSSRNIRDN